jgi:hypothetical protein
MTALFSIEVGTEDAVRALNIGKSVNWHKPNSTVVVRTLRLGLPSLWPKQNLEDDARFSVQSGNHRTGYAEQTFRGDPEYAARQALDAMAREVSKLRAKR